MEAFLFTLSLALLLAGGTGVALLLLPRGQNVTLLELTSLSILLGSGLISLSLFLGGFFLSGWPLRALIGALAVTLALIGWYTRSRPKVTGWPGPAWSERIAAVILAAQLGIVVWASLRLALGFDGLFIWESKARLIFQAAGSMPTDFLSGDPTQFPQPNYPLLVPLLESWFYSWMGEANQGMVKLVSPLFYLAIVGTLVSNGARLGGNRWRGVIPAVLIFFVPWVVLRTTGGEADIPLAAFYLAAVAYLLESWDVGAGRSLLLVGLLGAMLPWVKNEGVILWGCILSAVLMRAALRRQWREFAIVALPGIVWVAFWRSFLFFGGATEQAVFLPVNWSTLTANIDRIPTILRALIDEISNTRNWGLTWLLPLAGVAQLVRSRGRELLVIWLVLILVPMSLYASIYIFSGWQPFTDHMASSLSRLLLHLAPVTLLGISLLFPQPPKCDEDHGSV